jgi:hypothetical protein
MVTNDAPKRGFDQQQDRSGTANAKVVYRTQTPIAKSGNGYVTCQCSASGAESTCKPQ